MTSTKTPELIVIFIHAGVVLHPARVSLFPFKISKWIKEGKKIILNEKQEKLVDLKTSLYCVRFLRSFHRNYRKPLFLYRKEWQPRSANTWRFYFLLQEESPSHLFLPEGPASSTSPVALFLCTVHSPHPTRKPLKKRGSFLVTRKIQGNLFSQTSTTSFCCIRAKRKYIYTFLKKLEKNTFDHMKMYATLIYKMFHPNVPICTAL